MNRDIGVGVAAAAIGEGRGSSRDHGGACGTELGEWQAMASRFWQRIALVVAAAASVATSQLPEGWNVGGGAVLEATLLDATHTQVKYAIHAEVTGTGPYTD